MDREPPRFTRTYTIFPITALSRSLLGDEALEPFADRLHLRRVEPAQRGVEQDRWLDERGAARQRCDRLAMPGEARRRAGLGDKRRSEEHTSELQSLMRTSYAVFCLNNNKHNTSYLT